jgi:(E)-4-hydroxy-3-methylbut-2-enyl-diphosphate synthase
VHKRKRTRKIDVGDISLGGKSPIRVQSMTKTETTDVEGTIEQIKRLELAGCEMVRVAVPDEDAVSVLGEIKRSIHIPLIADVHFKHSLALNALDQGVDKIRINPGNIGSRDRIRLIVEKAKDKGVPIRVGVNAGSLESGILAYYGGPTAEALAESALVHTTYLEDIGFNNIVVSIKSSDIGTTVRAYEIYANKFHYPLHVGITAAGTLLPGSIRSSVGIGIMLSEGLGDTIRVSLTSDPVEEVRVAYEILRSLGLRTRGPMILACPTCGRCEIDVIQLAENVEKRLGSTETPLKIAVMGCVVNGPGEAREADVGIAGGKGEGVVFVRGKPVKKVPEPSLLDALIEQVQKMSDTSI